jgi:hypothetical protein
MDVRRGAAFGSPLLSVDLPAPFGAQVAALTVKSPDTDRGALIGLNACLFPGLGSAPSVPVVAVPSANACMPKRTPADVAADMAPRASPHADTTNSCPTRAASVGNSRDRAVRLMKQRGRHGLSRGCDG